MIWDLSEREYYRELVVARDRQIEAHDRDTTFAWCLAKLQRVAKMPDLESLLIRTMAATRQTIAEQKQMVEAISQAYNLRLRKATRRRG